MQYNNQDARKLGSKHACLFVRLFLGLGVSYHFPSFRNWVVGTFQHCVALRLESGRFAASIWLCLGRQKLGEPDTENMTNNGLKIEDWYPNKQWSVAYQRWGWKQAVMDARSKRRLSGGSELNVESHCCCQCISQLFGIWWHGAIRKVEQSRLGMVGPACILQLSLALWATPSVLLPIVIAKTLSEGSWRWNTGVDGWNISKPMRLCAVVAHFFSFSGSYSESAQWASTLRRLTCCLMHAIDVCV